MGRLAIVEENGREGPSSSATSAAAADSESGRIPEAVNNNTGAASITANAASTSSTVEGENSKRKAGNSDESGYLSEKGGTTPV